MISPHATYRKDMITRYITAFCVVMLPLFVYAQQIIELPHLDKLPVQSIHRIFQDKEGYIWYGTSDGLCRDDGYSIQVFRSDIHRPNIMQSNLIWTIAEDTHRQLWLGTDKGVYILDKYSFNIRPLDCPDITNERIVFIHSTRDGCIWVIPSRGGLYQFSPDGRLQEFYQAKNKNERFIYFYEDTDCNLWICLENEGLCRLNKESKSLENFSSQERIKENSIMQDRDGNYWVGTWEAGIKHFTPKAPANARYISQPESLKSDGRIMSIAQDEKYGYLWVVTYTGLNAFKINPHSMLEQVDISKILLDDNKMLSEITRDRDNNLWVAAYDQKSFMLNFQDNPVEEYEMPALRRKVNGNPVIVSLCKDESGFLWISQDRYGIALYNPDSDELIYFNDCPSTRNQPLYIIAYLIKSKVKGKVWAMSDNTYVYGVSHQNLSMQMEETINLKDITNNPGTLETIYEDQEGNLWMGTTTGLFVYHPSTKILESIEEITGIVSGITGTNDNALWVCVGNKGVYRIDKNNKQTLYPNKKDFSCIDATSDGKLWVGTLSGGVWLLDPKSQPQYTDYSLICDMNGDVLERIVVDDFNHVWLLTLQRAKEFNPRNNVYRDYVAPEKSFLLNRYLPLAAYKHTNNTLYFGGMPGFISIKSGNRLESIPKPVRTFITDIKIGEKSLLFDEHIPLESSKGIEIPADGHNIEIHFSTLDYRNTPQVRYAYRMEGIDKEWNYAVNEKNTAFYNQLSKGKYTFQVKATDENGLWSDLVTEITINKLPAWYETWWAYSLYTLFGLCFTIFILMSYLKRVKHGYKEEMDHQIQLKISELEKKPSPDELFLNKAVEIVESHLSDTNFDTNALAAAMNLSRPTFTRRLKQISGHTPLSFIKDIKMQHACRMLKDPTVSVTEVIIALGYNDHGHFTSTFKTMFGITPSEYQKKKD